MTQLLQDLREELVRRDYAASTIRSYVQIVEAFRQQTGARLDRITAAQLRRYHLFLLEERRLAVGTVVAQISALRFFCRYVLKRRDVREDLPYPKRRLRLPVVLSPDEVRCRTAALGGHLDRCGACGHRAVSYNSWRGLQGGDDRPGCSGTCQVRS